MVCFWSLQGTFSLIIEAYHEDVDNVTHKSGEYQVLSKKPLPAVRTVTLTRLSTALPQFQFIFHRDLLLTVA